MITSSVPSAPVAPSPLSPNAILSSSGALSDNLRQTDPAERAALSQLRDGDLAAVGWYASNGRVHSVPDRRRAVIGMIRAWAADIDAGRDSLLVAYRRDNVETLNRAARDLWSAPGGSQAPSSPLSEGVPTGPVTGSSPLHPDLKAPGSPRKPHRSPPSTRRPRPSQRSHPTADSCTWALMTSVPTVSATATPSLVIAPRAPRSKLPTSSTTAVGGSSPMWP